MNGRLYTIRQIIKRNGDLVEFNPQKIEHAIFRAMRATGVPDRKKAGELSAKV
ncbi:MAG TPA: ATP cone domain-containing protein, partial [Bacteroidales bacterium]|nr:ATP cone domain-containing protein [Bacteroidales bacterium]